jgi:hypothetical protein
MEKDNLSEKLSKAPSMREPLANNSPKEEDIEKMFADEARDYSLKMVKCNGGRPTDYYVHYMNGIIVGYKAATTKLNK